MRAATVRKIESSITTLATAAFAGAVAFAAFQSLDRVADEPGLGAFATAAALAAFWLCDRVLDRVAGGSPRFAVPIFDLGAIGQSGPGELLLTEADRLAPAADDDPLVLDDILDQIGPDSRVVRLFDPAAMPTPGQLKARIDRHLDDGGPPAAVPDASQALYDALAELRRSLR